VGPDGLEPPTSSV